MSTTLPTGDPDAPRGKPPSGPDRLVDREARNPWFRWTVHIGAPMGISLGVHGLLLFLAGLATVVAARGPREEIGEYEAGITDALADKLAADFKWQEETKLETPDEEIDLSSLTDLANVNDIDVSDIDTGMDDPGLGFGEGRGDVLGIGSGAGEAGSGGFGGGLGAGSRAGGGPVGLWGMNLIANKICYVIDFSGSIIVAQDDLVRELKRSVGKLRPPQAFNVYIFYSTGSGKVVTEQFKQDLQIARTEAKQAFFAWIDTKEPQGGTEPLDAIRKALKLEPEAVFFLSDGYFDEKIADEITAANKRTKAKLWTFVFDEILLQDTSGLPRDTDGSRRLARIARENNGRTKVVTGKDLEGR